MTRQRCLLPAALAAATLLGGAPAAWAQDAPTGPPAPPQPQRVEIQGVRADETEQRRREPVAKTIYGREELDRYGDIAVTDVLKRLPGVNLSGGNPRLRGLGAGYTLILINGEPAPPGFSLENLPPSQVERIEVTKGPTAEHSAQAVAGTINIILREAPRQRQRELTARIGYGRFSPGGGFNLMIGERVGRFGYALPVSGYRWSGGADNDVRRITRDLGGAPQVLALKGVDRWWGGGLNIGPRINWRPDERRNLELQGFAVRNEFRNAGQTQTTVLSGSTPTSVNDQSRNAGHWQNTRANLVYTHRADGGARLELRAGAQTSDSEFRTDVDGFDAAGRRTVERVITGSTTESGANSRGKWTLPMGETHTLAMGWEVDQRRRTDQRSVLENGLPQLADFEAEPFEARVRRAAAYVQDEWEFAPQWSAYLGLRLEGITTISRQDDQNLRARSEVVTPVLHLNHRLDPKGRDMVRASLTRAYKAPDLQALMARPILNNSYPITVTNPESGPDRVGNPALEPELSTGLDIAFERYFARGGVMSLGVFHRRIEGLIRNRVSLQAVPWASAPRWISQPVNLDGATSTGVELEVKGRATELLAGLDLPRTLDELNLRASLSVYRSSVSDIPGPDNRLEQQQPWSMTLGFDHRFSGWPVGIGASLAYTPGYVTQLTTAQSQALGRARNVDAYILYLPSRQAAYRLSVSNAHPSVVRTLTQTVEAGGFVLANDATRINRAQWNAAMTLKF